MLKMSLQDAQQHLAELLNAAKTGDVVEITNDDTTYRLTLVPSRAIRPRPPVTGVPQGGRWKGLVTVPDEFDNPLDEMREYME